MTTKITISIFAAISMLAGIGSAAVAQTPAQTPAYAAQLAPPSVADQFAIIDLISRMNHAIDDNNYPAYAGFYTEDGVIDSGFGPPTTGREAIVASLNYSAPFITNKRHIASNIVINGSETTATAVYYLTVLERKSGLTIAGTAMITDELRRGPGGWQVVRHTTRMDPATLAAMSAAMGNKAN